MKSLKNKYCIVGVGETEYSRASGRSTRAMAVEAIRHPMADAGLGRDGVDGMMSYQSGDSTPSNWVSADLGLRLNFFMDVVGTGARAAQPVRGLDLAQVPFEITVRPARKELVGRQGLEPWTR